MAVAALGLVGVAIHVWRELGRRWLKAALAVAVVLAAIPVGSGASTGEAATALVRAVLVLAGATLLIRFVLGANPGAYLLAAAWLAVLAAAAPLIAQAGRFYEVQGWLLLAVAAAASAWWLLRRPRERM